LYKQAKQAQEKRLERKNKQMKLKRKQPITPSQALGGVSVSINQGNNVSNMAQDNQKPQKIHPLG
jgi:hypothetical protein